MPKIIKKVAEIKVNTPYDDAFRTLVNDCSQLLIPMLNEIFGKHYTGEEEIVFHPGEHFINQQDGKEDKRITDSSFSIIGETVDRYILECQSRPDNSMLIRIFEYVTQIALDEGEITEDALDVTIPSAAILFLRTNKKTPDEMKIRMHTSGGDVQFGIPVMKVKNYSVNSIFEKKLYFLIPFYIFTHEDDFKSCESDNSKLEKLKQEYVEIFEKLEEAAAEGELSYYYMRSIIEMTKLVLENIARKYENVKEGVNSVMGGRVLEHESKTIYNEGWNEGRRDGKLEEKQATAKRLFEMGTKVADISRIVDASINLVRQWISTPANTANQTV